MLPRSCLAYRRNACPCAAIADLVALHLFAHAAVVFARNCLVSPRHAQSAIDESESLIDDATMPCRTIGARDDESVWIDLLDFSQAPERRTYSRCNARVTLSWRPKPCEFETVVPTAIAEFHVPICPAAHASGHRPHRCAESADANDLTVTLNSPAKGLFGFLISHNDFDPSAMVTNASGLPTDRLPTGDDGLAV